MTAVEYPADKVLPQFAAAASLESESTVVVKPFKIKLAKCAPLKLTVV